MTNSLEENKPKEPLVAVLWSLVYPGIGQIYAERLWRGFLFASTSLIILVATMIYLLHPTTRFYPYHMLLLILVSPVYVVFIIVDSYRCANAWNLDHGLTRKITRGQRSTLITGIFFLVFVLNPAALIAYGIKSSLAQAFKVPTEKMAPTLMVGDRVLVNKWSYRYGEPRRGDIVVYQDPEEPGKSLFSGRLAGLPGETLEIKDGKLIINHVPEISAPFAKISYVNRGEYGQEGRAVVIPSGHYYVLGDNSSKSRDDSRYLGFIPKKNLIGKIYKIYYPFDRSGPIE